jgi:uncharacterized phiE125 gp8 family phage protein
MTYQVTAPAATSYNTVAELKTHLLLFGDTSYDTELQDILLAAEEYISDFLEEYLIDTTVRVNVTSFDDTTLPHKFNTGVVVSYWDESNVAQVHAASNYRVDVSGDYPTIKYSAQPSGRSGTSTYAGYITYTTYMSVIPQKLNRAVLLVAAEMFESRREVSGSITYAASLASRRLIQSLRGW